MHLAPANNDFSAVRQFRRQSVWAVIGLTIITAAIYIPFWLRRQTRVLNQNLPNLRVPGWLFPVSLVLSILNIGWVIPEIITDDDPRIMAIGKIINKIDIVILIAYVFTVRHRMNLVLNAAKGSVAWLSGLLTFLLSIYYLQFKINRLQKELGLAVPTSDVGIAR